MNIAHKAFHALFSPPRSVAQSEAEDHDRNSTKPAAAPSAPAPTKFNSEQRCEFTFSDGRRCSNPAKVYPPPRKGYPQDALFAGNNDELSPVKKVRSERASFCAHHASKEAAAHGEKARDFSPLKEVAP